MKQHVAQGKISTITDLICRFADEKTVLKNDLQEVQKGKPWVPKMQQDAAVIEHRISEINDEICKYAAESEKLEKTLNLNEEALAILKKVFPPGQVISIPPLQKKRKHEAKAITPKKTCQPPPKSTKFTRFAPTEEQITEEQRGTLPNLQRQRARELLKERQKDMEHKKAIDVLQMEIRACEMALKSKDTKLKEKDAKLKEKEEIIQQKDATLEQFEILQGSVENHFQCDTCFTTENPIVINCNFCTYQQCPGCVTESTKKLDQSKLEFKWTYIKTNLVLFPLIKCPQCNENSNTEIYLKRSKEIQIQKILKTEKEKKDHRLHMSANEFKELVIKMKFPHYFTSSSSYLQCITKIWDDIRAELSLWAKDFNAKCPIRSITMEKCLECDEKPMVRKNLILHAEMHNLYCDAFSGKATMEDIMNKQQELVKELEKDKKQIAEDKKRIAEIDAILRNGDYGAYDDGASGASDDL